VTFSEEACYSPILSFEFELAPQLVMTKVRFFTFRELSVFTSTVEMHFMGEAKKLWTSFTSPKQLTTDFLSCAGDELDDLPPVLILVKTEGLGCLSLFSLQNTENLGVLSFAILLNIKGRR